MSTKTRRTTEQKAEEARGQALATWAALARAALVEYLDRHQARA